MSEGEPSSTWRYPLAPVQTRWLLLASAVLALVILIASGLWLLRLL